MWAWMENFGNFTDQIIIYNLILSNILNFSIKIWQMIIELFSKIKCWQYVNKLRLKYSKLLKYLTKPESWNLCKMPTLMHGNSWPKLQAAGFFPLNFNEFSSLNYIQNYHIIMFHFFHCLYTCSICIFDWLRLDCGQISKKCRILKWFAY